MALIDLQAVSLSYPIYEAKGRSLKNAVLRHVGGGLARDDSGRIEIQALRDINLRLQDGDRLALIGHNGAGKSTLLKVLAGIYEPPVGTVRIEGKVSSLTDVSLGLDIEATGSENIVSRLVFLGMNYADARKRVHSVEEFTELGDFLEMPLRTYSTGMQVRLAFAASTEIRPDILIMDEMIGAGDLAFAEKARRRLDEFVLDASILILASHDLEIVKSMCNRAILLEGGVIRMSGSVEDVIHAYKTGQIN
ncbi:ABC transporter ATP-binding protein [Mesorhizobium sp. 1B3]|uniref:ABC transporter ATP-binding protein n=1 Tax=Mesorhizobium sp. 1B3 TaxID=3243599 RepID=UPI003D975625